MSIKKIALSFSLILFTIFSLPTYAAIFTVTNVNDRGAGSLRAAIRSANAAGGSNTITFQSSLTGTMTLTSGQLTISNNLTVHGPAGLLAISGNHVSRVFDIAAGITVTLDQLTLKDGYHPTHGGGIYNAGTLTITDCVLTGNTAGTLRSGGVGGAIANKGTLTIASSALSGNLATYGGCIDNSKNPPAALTITNSTLSNNVAYGGSCIYNASGLAVTIAHSTLSGNTAGREGAGIYNAESAGSLTVRSSVLFDNTATASGGGIYNRGGLVVINSTLSGNTATTHDGGALWSGRGSRLTVSQSTVSDNAAGFSGGGLWLDGAQTTLSNSLVSGNTAPLGQEIRQDASTTSGAFNSQGHNLFGEHGAAGVDGVTLSASDLILAGTASTAIGPLANNGGTTLTHLPVAGSPALHAGDNGFITTTDDPTDQRGAGFPRVVGSAVDIGAVESPISSGATTDDLPTATTGNGSGSDAVNGEGSHAAGATDNLTASDADHSAESATVTQTTATLNAAATATTRFVRGVDDGLRTYAIIERNGVEFRTDEMGAAFNKGLWNAMSAADRKALVNTYGWQINRRRSQFGVDGSNAIADWINAEQGWTAAAEALKQRHANKKFPELAIVFGPGTTLEIPGFYCANPEIIKSADFKEAARLAEELQADYVVGKEVYTMLVNANWEQVAVAVKTLSEPLIKIIVDNFITGFITNGSSKVSELLVTAMQFRDDLKDFITGRLSSVSKPPTPVEIIARLEKYIGEMEQTAETARLRVLDKKSRLQALATKLNEACQTLTSNKKIAATTVRGDMQARAAQTPAAANLTPFQPRNPDGTAEEQQADIKLQAEDFVSSLRVTKVKVADDKNAAIAELSSTYGPYLVPPNDHYDAKKYLADVSDGFERPYFEVNDRIEDVEAWRTAIPALVKTWETNRSNIANAAPDTTTVLDTMLPRIDDIHAKLLWIDQYQGLLGYQPSVAFDLPSLRNFDPAIGIAASPDRTVEALANELAAAAETATQIQSGLPSGIDKRKQWMQAEAARYQSLRFNFENSLSFVIAALKQLDRLHAGPTFKRAAYPSVCYGNVCLYRYSVDIAGLRAAIAAKPTRVAREAARASVFNDLIELRAQEDALLHRLEIAQGSHLNDSAEISQFFTAVANRFDLWLSQEALCAEFAKYTSVTSMKTHYDLWHDLVPNITYYYLGDGSWIRNESNLSTPIAPALELISGKTEEYYLLLDLYNSMRTEKSRYLAMTTAQFNAFMTDVTMKIGTTPLGTWLTAFEIDGVWGVEWPAWQLVMKTQWLAEAINSEYRGNGIPDPVAWDIRGRIAADGGGASAVATMGNTAAASAGIGIPGVTVLLDGNQGTSTTTESDGSFVFTWIGSGNYNIAVAGNGYAFAAPTAAVKIGSADTTVAFTATETAASGYSIIGRVTNASAVPLEGVSLVLIPATGEERTSISGPDGGYSFFGVPKGTYEVRPVDAARIFTPRNRPVTLPASVTGANFIGVVGTTTDVDLMVKLSGTGLGRVTSSPAAIDCPGACSKSFIKGTTVTLSATASSGSQFVGWYGRCTGTAACTLTMDDIQSGTAVFDLIAAPDNQAPTITKFSLPATSTSLAVPVTFAASDNLGVTGYLVTTETAQPMPTDSRWKATAPATFTFQGPGKQIVFGWAKDAAGNISEARSAVVTVTIPPPITYTVTATAGANGSITPATRTVNRGATTTFIVTANPGYTAAVTGCGGTLNSVTGVYTTGPITAACTVSAMFKPLLTVTKTGTGAGLITGPGINCGVDCGELYPLTTPPTAITLTAKPALGSTFAGWQGACSNSTGSCTISMTAGKAVTARFNTTTAGTYALTVYKTSIGDGAGTVVSTPAGISCGSACVINRTSGASVTLTAKPATGSLFTGWSGACTGTGPCTVNMTAAKIAIATFTRPVLTIKKVGSGLVSSQPAGINCGLVCAAPYNLNTTVTLTATPGTGYRFGSWQGCTPKPGFPQQCTVPMNQAKTVTATFTR